MPSALSAMPSRSATVLLRPIVGLFLLLLPGLMEGQMAGTTKKEQHPPVAVAKCTVSGGCKLEQMAVTLDANWRWVHGQTCSGEGPQKQCYSSGNCYTGQEWDTTMCKDPGHCAKNCALEGVTKEDYANTYGVTAIPGGVKLKFVSMGAGGMNVGSRLYLLDTSNTYMQFRLLNREFTFTVDVSELPCGLNGAVYFSEMAEDGGLGDAFNMAGAKFGTGYCDAQCPHDVKFMKGYGNVLRWNATDATGKWGMCCTEVDIWEANRASTAFTMHPCSIKGAYVCKGKECGDNKLNQRYDGVCDKDGCDYNHFRMGAKSFYGQGSDFAVDTSKPITVVTQFLTDNGKDDGDLSEVRRLYVQDGKVIKNSKATILGNDAGDSITDDLCKVQKEVFEDPDDFAKKGGLKQTGEALRRGMTLVLSLWDDTMAHMLWLDSEMGKGGPDHPGTLRGPCSTESGIPQDVRAKYPDAFVTYTNIMHGEIGSTYTGDDSEKPDASEATGLADEEDEEEEGTSDAAWGGGSAPSPAPPAWQPPQQAPAPQPPLSGAGGGSSRSGSGAQAYQQCGGTGWTGPQGCQGNCECIPRGDTYSQCVPPQGHYQCGGDTGAPSGDDGTILMKNSLGQAGGDGASGLRPVIVPLALSASLVAALAAVFVAVWRGSVIRNNNNARESADIETSQLLNEN